MIFDATGPRPIHWRACLARAAVALASILAISGCGGGGNLHAVTAVSMVDGAAPLLVKMPNQGMAKLGTLAGATVELLDLHGDTPFYTTTTDASGKFKLDLGTHPLTELYRVRVSGGTDTDVADTGAAGQAPAPNASVLTAYATGKQIAENGVSVNVLSDALARRIGDSATWNSVDLVMRELDGAAQSLVATDINGDGAINYLDILGFDPGNAVHKQSLTVDYEDFFLPNPAGKSVMDLYHANDPGLNDELDAVLSDSLDLRLPDADAAALAALDFGVEGHGSVQSSAMSTVVDHDMGRYIRAVDKATTSTIQVRATPAAGGTLLAWEGCEQDATDPLLCHVTPDVGKSVVAIFQDVNTVAENTSVVHLPATAGTVGFVLQPDKAVITLLETDPVVAQLDAALQHLAANPAWHVFLGGERAKQATLQVTSVGTRTVLDGVVRYAVGYADAAVTDALASGSVYAPPTAISVDSIASLTYSEDGSPDTATLPQNEANADAVAGPNPVDPAITTQLCGNDRTQHLLVDGNVACIAPSNLPVQSETGLLHACAAGETLVESLDGEEYCVAHSDINQRAMVRALSARVRAQGAPTSRATTESLLKELQQPVHTTTDVPAFKKGQVAWLVGYGRAIYLAHNVFMVDRADGRGISMVTVDGAIESVPQSSKRALAYQLCTKDLGAPECRFVGRAQAASSKPTDQRSAQADLLPVPLVYEVTPEGAPWITFKFKVNVDLTGTSSGDFDWGTLYYSFGSRGNIAVTPVLNTTITADGLALFEKPTPNSPATDRKEVDKAKKLESGKAVYDKEIIKIDFIKLIPGVQTVSPVLESNLGVSIGVDASGEAKIDITTSYKHVVAWDVRSEFVYRVVGANTNNQSFQIASKGFPGVTVKGDLNASIGLFAKAEVTLGVRAIIPKLTKVEAKFYPLKVDALGKVLLSYQTDPPKVEAQNGQNFCWAGAVSLTVRSAFEANAGYNFNPKSGLLMPIAKYVDLPKKEYSLYSVDKVLWTIGRNIGAFVQDPKTGDSTEADRFGQPVDTLQPDTKLACAAPTPDKEPVERTYAADNLELDSGGSRFTRTHELAMQADGNLVLYAWNGTRQGVVWSTQTNGKGQFNRAKFQADGNFVVQDVFENVLFSSGSYGVGAKSIKIASRGALEITTADGTVLWSSDGGSNSALPARKDFTPGTLTLNGGDSVLTANRLLVMQPDGNLVLYRVKDGHRDGAAWASDTRDGAKAVFQVDGNLVVYRADGTAAWSSGTDGRQATRLSLQPDGNLVIYSNDTALWARGL